MYVSSSEREKTSVVNDSLQGRVASFIDPTAQYANSVNSKQNNFVSILAIQKDENGREKYTGKIPGST